MKRFVHHRSTKGFTLVELMITFLLASVVMAAVFVMYTQTSKSFHKEEEYIAAHAQLRFAMDHLKNDVRRAAYQATPNADKDGARVCWTPPSAELRAIKVARQDGYVHLPGVNQKVEPSSITLFGDYFSPEGTSFYAFQVDAAGNVFLDPQDPSLATMSKGEFEAIFRPNVRWLRVVTKDEKEWYGKIAAVDYANRRLTLAATPPPSGYCLAGFGQGEVNPVGWIRYELREDTRTSGLLADGAELRNIGKTDLVRVEVNENGTAIDGTALVVGEYIVDLQFYDFGLDMTTATQATDITVFPLVSDVVQLDGTGLLGQGFAGPQPENLRFLTVKVSARTPNEDRDLYFEPREGLFKGIFTFDIEPELDGASRVLSLASRVDLRNLALRRVK